MLRLLAAILVLPALPARSASPVRKLLWPVAALLGLPLGKDRGGFFRRSRLLLQGFCVRLLLLTAVAYLTAIALLHGSLPPLDGERRVAVREPVRIERDGLGVPTIRATNRRDLAFGLGFVHAQDRYFQMDLSRRFAAGELAALFGPAAVPTDRDHRIHRFRALASRVVQDLDSLERDELEGYVDGVNAGLASLRVRPFEYLLLGATPEPWTGEDTVLVLLSMFLTLQDHLPAIESALGVARDTLPGPLFTLLSAAGDEWDAPLVGGPLPVPPLPGPDVIDLRRRRESGPPAPPLREPSPSGSNNWAVAGSRTRHGGALVANDMHLGLRVPNTWYRAALHWRDPAGRERGGWGATLPGTPGLVVGSNGRVAWGLTNAEGDWADLVELEGDPRHPATYRTPAGPKPFEVVREVIRVKGAADETLDVQTTVWGPVVDRDHRGRPRALRWVAHDREAVNFAFARLLEADTLEDLFQGAHHAGAPHVNLVAADDCGRIGWTLLGRVPKRVGHDGRTPTSWADGSRRWEGYVTPEEIPTILHPKQGYLWTANNRTMAGDALTLLGHGGYDRGPRAKQIRDRLAALEQATEADMLAVQLDDEARFLTRWRELLLSALGGRDDGADREEARLVVTNWGGRAAVSSAGYRLVLEFRTRVVTALLDPLVASCRRADRGFTLGHLRNREGAAWRLLTERPPHLLDPQFADYDALLRQQADRLLKDLASRGRRPAEYTWGKWNTVRIRHPLSSGVRALPVLGGPLARWLDLDMPEEELDGGPADLPRVQGPSFGASQRLAVSPGREAEGYFHMPCGQSGHPRSPHYRDGHHAWARGEATPLLPGETRHGLTLVTP